MYAAKAASAGGPAGQVQGQPGVPSSGQGMYGLTFYICFFYVVK